MPIQIDGATRLYLIVGDPIVQVKSASVYSHLFAERGIHAVLLPLHVLPADMDGLAPMFQAMRNVDGILVTAPYKSSLLKLCRSLGPAAECVGAVNALRRHPDGGWHGDLFDGAGFVTGARRRGIVLEGRRILQFGAGGAGSAVAYELAAAGARSIRLIDPHHEKVHRICDAIRSRFPGFDIQACGKEEPAIDMVINASTVGMGGTPGLPGPIPPLGGEMAVGEVNVTEKGTELIRMAQAAGVAWVDGSFMHAGQIDQIMAFFFGQAAALR